MKDLTVGKESKLIFQFAIPMLLGNVFQQLYNVVDSMVVGRFIGKQALAAVGASFPLIFILISVVIGFSMGLTVIISQYFGAKDFRSVKRAIDTLNIVLFFSSIVVTILSIAFSGFIFQLIKLPADVIPLAKEYFNTYMLGSIAFFGFNGTSAILRGMGDSKTPLYFLIISTLVNIILVLLFVVGFGWGIRGAAIATITAQAVSFILAIIYLNKYHKLINISFLNLEFDKKIFFQSLRIGLPSGLQFVFVSMGMMALFGIVNSFGTDVAAAYSGALRIDSFATMPAMTFAMALSSFVGQNIGANKIDRVKNGLIATLKMTSIIAIVVSLVVIIFGQELMNMFTTDVEVKKIGHEYLIVVCSFYLLFTSMFIIGAVMRGAGDTLASMFISLFALWIIRIPVAYILAKYFGVRGIWWSVPIGWAAGLIMSYVYYKTGRWKNKSVIKHDLPPVIEAPLE